MHTLSRRLMLAATMTLSLAAAGCDDGDDDALTGPSASRTYTQIERLGNPLVSEVFFDKRDHGFHNTNAPANDVANFKAKVEAFPAAFGRSTTIRTTLSAVLLPDMLIVQTDKAASGAGWLTWALANGWGGRKLTDDVVDAGLAAIFGTLVDPAAGTVAGLTSDNVPSSVRTFSTTFPYLNAAN